MNQFIKQEHEEAMVDHLSRLLSYPSVLNEGENGTPFGQAIQDVLEVTLEICRDLGFTTYLDPKGYYGYAEVGQGAEIFAILCHLDVVPAGDLSVWQSDPFQARVEDGKIYGRGSQDDKGPSVAALMAVKALMDAGVSFHKRVRLIFGTDEETLWRCMNRYNELEEPAAMGFAPDASFPLIYAEKGLLQAKLHGPGSDLVELEAGEAFNVVPGKATYSGKYSPELALQLQGLGYDYEEEGDNITVLGLSKHSKDAAKGINAIIRLATALGELVDHPVLDFLVDEVGDDATGGQVFGAIQDEPSGSLSFNVAGLSMNGEESEIRLDLRIPVLADKEALVKELTDLAAKYDLTYEEFDYLAPLYVPGDSELVQTLLAVYQEKTGDMESTIQSSGGATFARTMKNCVACGAAFPYTQKLEHMENEAAVIAELVAAMEIYAEVVYRLAANQE